MEFETSSSTGPAAGGASNNGNTVPTFGTQAPGGTLERNLRYYTALRPDMVVYSHLRWDFVFQRPQHLMNRFGNVGRVFFIEEPVEVTSKEAARLSITSRENNIWIAVPQLPAGLDEHKRKAVLRQLIEGLFNSRRIVKHVAWYYTPMMLPLAPTTPEYKPELIVYDVMDELSAFKFAPSELLTLESELYAKADIVFTGGTSLYEVKKERHPRVSCFPSSIDAKHFGKARQSQHEPADQASIPPLRVGFFGVIDERMDLELVGKLAAMRPELHFVFLGPVVKIDPETLPQGKNLHFLGPKNYQELPRYIAYWDVAMMPFALNESTRYISPTKTPEYLAAGRPVVSTPIRDVVHPYGNLGLVEIAETPEGFSDAIDRIIKRRFDAAWQAEVDGHLAPMSWDTTWTQMVGQMAEGLRRNRAEGTETHSSSASTSNSSRKNR